MPKGMSKIGMLPYQVRTEINVRLREGCRQDSIAKWLFGRRADRAIPDLGVNAGDSYAVAWTQHARNAGVAETNCAHSISSWFRGRYRHWLREQERLEGVLLMVKRIEEHAAAASEKGVAGSSMGAAILVRSMLLSVLEDVYTGDKNPTDIARLANAWARTNQAGIETEKMTLQTREAVDAGLDALHEEMKQHPETKELFERLRAAVKRCMGQPK